MGGQYKELCVQVSVASGVRTVGQAVDQGTEINHQKPVLRCGNGLVKARSEYKVDILRDGPGIPNIGEPFAVQVRERIECLFW